MSKFTLTIELENSYAIGHIAVLAELLDHATGEEPFPFGTHHAVEDLLQTIRDKIVLYDQDLHLIPILVSQLRTTANELEGKVK